MAADEGPGNRQDKPIMSKGAERAFKLFYVVIPLVLLVIAIVVVNTR